VRNSLFWRLFWAFLSALTATVLVLSLIMVAMVRTERRAALENEALAEVRELTHLIKQEYMLSLFQSETEAVQSKIDEIEGQYNAQISIVYRNRIQKSPAFTAELNDPAVVEYINRAMSGEEIRVQGVFSGAPGMITFGVPYTGISDQVMGVLLLHLGMDSLRVDYTDIIRYAAIACIFSMILGASLSYLIASKQSKPLRAIQRAVADFAAGAFDRRVETKGGGEMVALADSFNQMAEELSNLEESRRTFVANVSHELRSPMTSIQGYIHGILDGAIAEEERAQCLNVVLSETQRLTKLINELLALSRYDSGKEELNLSGFDINALILQVMFKYEQRIEAKRIDVEIAFREPSCAVFADADRITQVVENLIDNAVKFTGEDGRITVWSHTVDQLCYVTIKNTGPGIAPDDSAFIFDRFYKGDKAHTSGMGTGLGLSIAKKILEQHGQSIHASSGGGETSFVFTLRRGES